MKRILFKINIECFQIYMRANDFVQNIINKYYNQIIDALENIIEKWVNQ